VKTLLVVIVSCCLLGASPAEEVIRELTCQEVATAVKQTEDFMEAFNNNFLTSFCNDHSRIINQGQCLAADLLMEGLVENKLILIKFWGKMGCQRA
jgi:hypothetical protein